MNFVDELKQYFIDTPREKVLYDWEKSKEYDGTGPTVEEFTETFPIRTEIKRIAEDYYTKHIVIKFEPLGLYISESGNIILTDPSLVTPAQVMQRKRELLWELRKTKNKKRKIGKILLDILEKEVAAFPKN